jgi:hypothetical protein
MEKLKIKLMFFVLCIFSIGYFDAVLSQHAQDANPADVPDIQCGFVNPAVCVIQDPFLFSGIRILHIGLLNSNTTGIRQYLFSISHPGIPIRHFGLGLTVNHLLTPMHMQTVWNFNLAFKFGKILALGIRNEFQTLTFPQESHDLIDPQDPLLKDGASRTTFHFGAGLLYHPFKDLSFGISAHHLNRPNLSFGSEEIPQPLWIDLGASLGFSFYRISAGTGWVGSEMHPSFQITTDYLDFGNLSFGYGYSGLRFGFDLKITPKTWLDYEFTYPTSRAGKESAGSHQFHVVFYLRTPYVPENTFTISTDVDSVFILEQHISMEGPDSLLNLISSLTSTGIIPEYHVNDLIDSVSTIFNPKYYSKSYLALFDTLQGQILIPLRFVVDSNTVSRARGIRDAIMKKNMDRVSFVKTPVLPDKRFSNLIPAVHSVAHGQVRQIFISHPEIGIHLDSEYQRRTESWRLEIKNSRRIIVKSFQGRGRIPATFHWKLIDKNNKRIEPDWYTVQFYWRSINGVQSSSPVSYIQVVKEKRIIDWQVLLPPKQLTKKYNGIDVFLQTEKD